MGVAPFNYPGSRSKWIRRYRQIEVPCGTSLSYNQNLVFFLIRLNFVALFIFLRSWQMWSRLTCAHEQWHNRTTTTASATIGRISSNTRSTIRTIAPCRACVLRKQCLTLYSEIPQYEISSVTNAATGLTSLVYLPKVPLPTKSGMG